MVGAERHRWRRVAGIALAGVAIEAALFGLTRLAPAMGGLVRPMYAAVAGVVAFSVWRAAQSRRGQDRREADRRRPPSPDGGPRSS